MGAIANLYRTSIGKKIAMALSGAILVLFVIGHMIGNLKMYQGADKYDAYAEGLRTFGAPILGEGQFLWIARIVLLAAVGIHIVSAYLTWRQSKTARDVGYRKSNSLSFSYASKTMRWGGVVLLFFIVYHLLHLTVGSAHENFEQGEVYRNVVIGFSNPIVSLVYLAAMIPLGFHLYHGIWSAFQTLSIDNAKIRAVKRPLAQAIAIVVVLGNLSFPIAVLTGVVALPEGGRIEHEASIERTPTPGDLDARETTGTIPATGSVEDPAWN